VARRDDDAGDLARPGPGEAVLADPDERALERPGDPPVVARLVVEIRSDGRMTIARGAMEDRATGRGVAIEATGRTPLQLAFSLARALVTLPAFGRSAARALLRGPRGDGPHDEGGGEGGGQRGGTTSRGRGRRDEP
jgi:hypothetical protein